MKDDTTDQWVKEKPEHHFSLLLTNEPNSNKYVKNICNKKQIFEVHTALFSSAGKIEIFSSAGKIEIPQSFTFRTNNHTRQYS